MLHFSSLTWNRANPLLWQIYFLYVVYFISRIIRHFSHDISNLWHVYKESIVLFRGDDVV